MGLWVVFAFSTHLNRCAKKKKNVSEKEIIIYFGPQCYKSMSVYR